SEEIHDNMGQVLSLVVLHLSAIEFSDQGSAMAKLNTSTDLVKKVVADLRNLSKSLDAENMIKVGLPAIIRNELELIGNTGRFSTGFSCIGPEMRLEPAQEIVAYRIVQESLNNAIKHSHATELRIAVEFGKASLLIGILDNGIGFDARALGSSNGAGLKN